MDKLLTKVSWTAYLETISVLAISYYLIITWKYYRKDILQIRQRLIDRFAPGQDISEILQYNDDQSHPDEPAEIEFQFGKDKIPHGAIRPELKSAVLTRINAACDKPYNPPALITDLKTILNRPQQTVPSHERDQLNKLIVEECEKTGAALLSESEVDLWWSA